MRWADASAGGVFSVPCGGMRIIAGEHRGRKLLSPESDATRPITDRVKQSLFDIIAPDIPGAVVYDCFSGTGSMGLECLSRGARHATFFDADRSALLLLRQNIESLHVQEKARVIPGDLFKYFTGTRPTETEKPGLIFLDPPYRFVVQRSADIRALVSAMLQYHLAPGGYIIFRHDAADNLEFADAEDIDRRNYGNMAIRFLRGKSAAA